MTSNYKILGQLYYGPEINETPEIPGTSGYYTYTTGKKDTFFTAISSYGSNYQVDASAGTTRDGVFSYSDVPDVIGSYNMNQYSTGFSFQNNKFIRSVAGTTAYQESYDGINWNTIQLSMFGWDWHIAVSSTNYHIAVKNLYNDYNNAFAYSPNGITWTLSWRSESLIVANIIAVDDTFYMSASTDNSSNANKLYKFKTIEEYDVNTYTQMSHIIYQTSIKNIVQYKNKMFFFKYPEYNGHVYYSTDHINWYPTSLNYPWLYGQAIVSEVDYDGNNFIGLTQDNWPAVSQDGITWSAIDMAPSNNFENAVIKYTNGIYILMSRPSDAILVSQYSYSSDLINWVPPIDMPRNFDFIETGEINTLEEVQISIGGQGTPGSYVETVEPQVLYTVPAGKQVVVSSIFVTNHDSVTRTYDLAIVPSEEVLSLKHHIKWDYAVASNDFNMLDQKITMNAGDSIWVFPSTVNKIGFTAMGVEIS